jgi:membrane protein YqaA with SNARE-associated domain
MGRFVARAQALALALGAPGLFVVALLDSSVLSLPEIADLLVVWMVTVHKARLVLYAVSATLGSLAGCLLLYYLGKKGGDAFVRKQFSNASIDRALAAFQRYGVIAVVVPSLLPPPFPFKIFVLLSGVAEIGVTKFATAIAIGRGARYFVEGLLAVRYGDRAMTFIREHGTRVSLAVVGVLVAGLVMYLVWTKADGGKRR